MKTAALFRFAALLLALLAATAATRGDELDAVKARMTQRLNAVNAIKDRGIAGENNQGFLELRGRGSAAEQKTMADENADRRVVYQALAVRTGTMPDTVGRQRAQQLATIARRGVWIQDASGAWRQKE